MTRRYRIALWLFLGLYLGACALPATEWWDTPEGYRTDDPLKGGHYVTAPGWECLALGWMFLPYVVQVGSFGMLAWLANPLALISLTLLLFLRTTGAAVFGAASVVLGVLYLIDPPGKSGYPDLPQVGAWLWVGSFLALTLAALIRRKRLQAEKHVVPVSQPIA